MSQVVDAALASGRLDLAPHVWFNRVEAGHLGLGLYLDAHDRLRLSGRAGYQTGREAWAYGGGLRLEVAPPLALSAGTDSSRGAPRKSEPFLQTP